jgi:hypothetical protein
MHKWGHQIIIPCFTKSYDEIDKAVEGKFSQNTIPSKIYVWKQFHEFWRHGLYFLVIPLIIINFLEFITTAKRNSVKSSLIGLNAQI